MKFRISNVKAAIALSICLLIAGLSWWVTNRNLFDSNAAVPGTYGTYTTSFSAAENPISENGNWSNGRSLGLKWADVQSSPGFAFGTQMGNGGYDDSTAVVLGNWGPTQTVAATVRVTNASNSASVYEEVELRLRTAIAPNSLTGYEVNFSCSANPSNYYAEIVRWNGALGSFTYLDRTKYHVKNGDVVKATISGKTIQVYVNDSRIMSATDNTFASGSPGIGFFLKGTGPEANADFGFSSFTATDGPK